MRLNCSFLDAWDSNTDPRFDSLSAFVENQLKSVVPETYDRLYPQLDANQHIPIKSNINFALPAWAYDSMDKRGSADFFGANGSQMPRVDVAMQRFTFPIRTIITAYGWTLEEIEAARAVGMPLDRSKAEAARYAIAKKEHELLLSGDTNHNIPGFLTNASIPLMAAPNGSWLNGATADQMIDDLHAMLDKVFVGSKRLHKANTVLLDVQRFRYFATKRVQDTGISALQYFQQQNPGVTVGTLIELATADAAGTGPRAVAYDKNPSNLAGIVPLSFQQLEPQMQGMETLIPCRAREGGTVVYYPLSACFMDGL